MESYIPTTMEDWRDEQPCRSVIGDEEPQRLTAPGATGAPLNRAAGKEGPGVIEGRFSGPSSVEVAAYEPAPLGAPGAKKVRGQNKVHKMTRRVPSGHQRARPGTYLGSREHGAAIRAEIGGTPLARDDASHLVGACAAPRVVELTALTSVCDTGAKNFLSSRSVGANSAATRAHPQRLTHPRVSLTPVGAAP